MRTKRTHRLQPWEKQAIIDAYRNKEKIEAIAAEFNVTSGYVSQLAAAVGLSRRRKSLEPAKPALASPHS